MGTGPDFFTQTESHILHFGYIFRCQLNQEISIPPYRIKEISIHSVEPFHINNNVKKEKCAYKPAQGELFFTQVLQRTLQHIAYHKTRK